MGWTASDRRANLLWAAGGAAVTAAVAGAYVYLARANDDNNGKNDDNNDNNDNSSSKPTRHRPARLSFDVSSTADDTDGEVDVDSREHLFEEAVEFMNSPLAPQHINTEQKLMLYALYKQATEGDCDLPRPSMLNMRANAKWEARQEFIGLECEQARDFYVKLVDHESPEWQSTLTSDDTQREEAGSSYDTLRSSDRANKPSGDATLSLGGTASQAQFSAGVTSAEEEQAMWAEGSDIWYLVSTGERDAVLAALGADSGPMINSTDEEGRSLLHWACDRG
jgi:acyl-CoA-binding protein